MDKIQKMVEAYNKKARKWGFDEIEIVNCEISKKFSEKSTEGKGFFGKVNTLYQNGYMKEDYNKIKKALWYKHGECSPTIKNALPKADVSYDLSLIHFPYEEPKHELSIEEQALANTFRG